MGTEHWVQTNIGEMAEVIGGGTPDSSDVTNFANETGIAWLTPKDLSGYSDKYIAKGERFLTKKGFANSSAKLLPTGTVLFSSRAPIGYVAIAANEICTNQGFKNFVCSNGLYNEYAYYYLIFAKSELQAMGSGTTFKEISGSVAKTIPIPLPPFSEQKRIVEKLDSILPKVKSIKARLDKIPQILKRFRQSILSAACSGKLTENWREENHDCEEWKSVFLKDVALSRLGKMLDQSKNCGNPTPYLRNTNVRWFDFDLHDVFTMKTTKEELPELWIKKGDVLICEGGEPGRCAIWQGADNSYIFQKALHRVRVGDTLLGKWLCFNIRDAANSGRLEDFFTGTTIKHLTGVKLRTFDFFLPPLEEQHEIVRRVEKLFKLADSLEAKYKKAMERVEKIEQSVLAKAFRGELAPQDPNDEPAEELLKRILAEKAIPSIAHKGRRRAKLQTPRKKPQRSLRPPR